MYETKEDIAKKGENVMFEELFYNILLKVFDHFSNGMEKIVANAILIINFLMHHLKNQKTIIFSPIFLLLVTWINSGFKNFTNLFYISHCMVNFET